MATKKFKAVKKTCRLLRLLKPRNYKIKQEKVKKI